MGKLRIRNQQQPQLPVSSVLEDSATTHFKTYSNLSGRTGGEGKSVEPVKEDSSCLVDRKGSETTVSIEREVKRPSRVAVLQEAREQFDPVIANCVWY
ncbi:hypothetical protein LWI28_005946 [Acer negundo]|uniref:Uncharacterized protein n=1 Tax=Acer negundo TaxID=4023 RepID=A0AAD5I5L8_ACENE|nr:hypothetical protein LWI28_005946 [Acer negundo]